MAICADAKLAAQLKRGLAEHGYAIDVAPSGMDGRQRSLENEYELIVLDAPSTCSEGIALLEALRRERDTPVVMLGDAANVRERVRALRAGADDFIVKPVEFIELLARIQAVLRRGRGIVHGEPDRMVLGDLELDLTRRRAHRAGIRLELSAREYTLLAVLLRHRGVVLSRTELAEQVWEMNVEADSNVVEVAIRRLRAKLDEPFPTKLLHTVRGMGYVLELESPDESR